MVVFYNLIYQLGLSEFLVKKITGELEGTPLLHPQEVTSL